MPKSRRRCVSGLSRLTKPSRSPPRYAEVQRSRVFLSQSPGEATCFEMRFYSECYNSKTLYKAQRGQTPPGWFPAAQRWLRKQGRRHLNLDIVNRVINFYNLNNDARSKGLFWHPPRVGRARRAS